MDNELLARLIYHHQLASREQLLESWPEVTPEKNIALLLVERRLLTQDTYRQLLGYVDAMGGQGGQGQAAPPTPAPGQAQPAPGGSPAAMAKAAAVAASAIAKAAVPPKPAATTPPPKPTPTPPPASPPTPAAPRPATTAQNGAGETPGRLPGDFRGVTGEGQLRVAVPANLRAESGLEEILVFARQQGATDVHLSPGNPILLRRFGLLQPATGEALSAERIRAMLVQGMPAARLEEFERSGDLECIHTIEGAGRFRVTLMRQRSGWDFTARVVPMSIRSLEDSGLPEPCRSLSQWAQGLVLVTGPVGCGKTSTLATLVEMVNQTRRDHIITFEDPIEIVFRPAGCQITQRQIKLHTLTQEAALRGALRQDPDILVISELRDLGSIQLAVSAAETGHLVFGTMNTTNASRTIYRLIDSFPPEEQPIIRSMISESLRGVISQQLIPRKDGKGVVPAYEVLMVNSAVANMIRKDETHQLGTAMITGKSSGMVLLDDSLRALVERGLIAGEEAYWRATNPKDFEKYLARK